MGRPGKPVEPSAPSAPDVLLERIRRVSPTLPRQQQQVVEYFLSHCDQAVFSTSTQVGRAVSVSEATVVRTARALGFGGYPQFRAAFQTYFVDRMSTVTRVRLTAARARKESDIIDEVMTTDLRNLEATRLRLDHKSLLSAAELIAKAPAVHVVGLRGAYGIAWLLHFSLMLISVKSHLITPGLGETPEHLDQVRPRDAVVGITFWRYTRTTVEVFRACMARGARGIALTDKLTSPLADGAEVVLDADTRLSSFIDSAVAPTTIVNVLVTLVAARNRKRVLKALAQREESWQRQRIYI
jgi:DNA-binding MurR/RpiR family transcriptional regulator